MEPPTVNVALEQLASFICKQIVTWVTECGKFQKTLQMLESRDLTPSKPLFPKLKNVGQMYVL